MHTKIPVSSSQEFLCAERSRSDSVAQISISMAIYYLNTMGVMIRMGRALELDSKIINDLLRITKDLNLIQSILPMFIKWRDITEDRVERAVSHAYT